MNADLFMKCNTMKYNSMIICIYNSCSGHELNMNIIIIIKQW
jgi:hypothetical protein